MTQEEMIFETSTATSNYNKPRIRKGFYAGELLDARMAREKPKKEGELGELRENKYGHQAVLTFGVYKLDTPDDSKPEECSVGKAVTSTEGNITTDVILTNWINTDSKNTEKGTNKPLLDKNGKQTYRSAFTPKSRATATFKALGWNGPEMGKKLNMQDFIGKFVELTIDDYDLKDETGALNGKSASGIKDIKAFKGTIPDGLQHVKLPERTTEANEDEALEATEEDVIDDTPEIIAKIDKLKEVVAMGGLSPEGFNTAVANLRKRKT